jgi:hypothetical protein
MTAPDRFDEWMRDHGMTDPQVAAARADDGPGERDDRDFVIDLDEVARFVREAGFPASVDQTGGGTATICAGDELGVWAHRDDPEQLKLHGTTRTMSGIGRDGQRRGPDVEVAACDGECYRYEALAGPGWFDGPAWTRGRADLRDFYVGPDDDGSADPRHVPDDATAESVAALIVGVIREGRDRR